MTPQAQCGFCHHPIDHLPDVHKATACARCGSALVVVHNLKNAADLSALTHSILAEYRDSLQQRMSSRLPDPPADGRLETLIVPVGDVFLVTAWSPDEPMTTPEVAKALGVASHQSVVRQIRYAGIYPGAFQVEPIASIRTRAKRSQRTYGRWYVPRLEVWQKMHGLRRSAAGR